MLRAKFINKVTEVNKIYLENIIQEGDVVVDATMGNGYDTVYLAKKVGENGKVYAFDVQEEALKSTTKKVNKEELNNVELILDGHQNMDKYVKEEVSCIVFNLGYPAYPRAFANLTTVDSLTPTASPNLLAVIKATLS